MPITDQPQSAPGRAFGAPARRQAVLELLKEAYAHDQLDAEEYERRAELAVAARTIEELDRIVADFPADIRPAAAALPASEAEIDRLDGLSAPTEVTVFGDQRIVAVRGEPPLQRSVSLLGDVVLDLRPLSGQGGVYLIKIVSGIGDTKIIVPPGTVVESRHLSVLGDKAKRRSFGFLKRLGRNLGLLPADDRPASPPGPRVIVTGFKFLGDTVIVEES
jgi:hypothetical protein